MKHHLQNLLNDILAFYSRLLPWEKPNKCAREDSVRVGQNVSLKVELILRL